jgi:isopenicillin N synthase-like dioxygenase
LRNVTLALVDLGSDTAADDVRRACEEIGFLIVTGHGVDPSLVDEIDRVSRAFFDLPLEEKLRLRDGDLQPDRPIYRPVRSESLAATSGAKRHGDLKESLDYGPTLPGAGWPARPSGLEQAYRSYLAAMNGLGSRLRHVCANALGHDDDFFEPLFDHRGSSLRVINYPELDSPPEPGELRAGAHRDYGFLTILRSENVAGGLQVQTRAGEWVTVEAPPGSFVVNLGDMLAEWTAGRWVSTLHRVAAPTPGAIGTRRQSLVFFHNPRDDAYVDALDATAGEYILAKAAQAFGT